MDRFYNDIIDNVITLRIIIALIILVIVFLIGTIGYYIVEDMRFFDGFYMTFITISTIGFTELKTLSVAGRVLTMAVFIMGIGVISYIASQTTQLIFESKIFRRRAMKRQLDKMNHHYIVAGYGRIGHRITEVLKDANIPIVVIEKREDTIEQIREDKLLYVEGNAQDESVLKEAGIERAKGLICTLPRDQDNVFVTLIGRELNPDIFILVRTNQHQNTKKILRAGANKVISPYEIGADRMANVILRPHVDQFMDRILGGATQDHVFDEVKVFKDSDLAGKTLSEAGIRQKYFVVIIAIIPDDKDKIRFNPGRDDKVKVGDSLIVLGDVDRIKQLREEGCEDFRTLEERVSRHKFMKHINFHQNNTQSA